MSTSHLIERNSSPAKRPPSDPPITTACFAALAWFLIGAPWLIRPLGFRAWRHGALKGCCHQEVDGTAGVSSTTELPYASRQLRLVPERDMVSARTKMVLLDVKRLRGSANCASILERNSRPRSAP